MNIDDIKNMAVIGAGNMGHQISLLCAIHGYKTCARTSKRKFSKKRRTSPTRIWRAGLKKDG